MKSSKSSKVRFSISLDEKIVNLIEKKRGDVPRSTFINSILMEHFKLSRMKGGNAK